MIARLGSRLRLSDIHLGLTVIFFLILLTFHVRHGLMVLELILKTMCSPINKATNYMQTFNNTFWPPCFLYDLRRRIANKGDTNTDL
jgi:hypothetical protein